MKRFTAKTPAARPPLFWVGDKLFVDLLYNYGHELEVGFADVQRYLVAVPPEAILLARRLDGAELRAALRDLSDAHANSYGRLVPTDAARWQQPKKQRRRR